MSSFLTTVAFLLLAAALGQQPAPAAAAPVAEADLQRHVTILASDDFEGRKPGTPGEAKTLRYLASQFSTLGLVGGATGGGWYQPVPLINARASSHIVNFVVSGRSVDFGSADLVLVGNRPVETLAQAPVWLVGAAALGDLAGANLSGAVVLIDAAAASSAFGETAAAMRRAGAAAVIAVLGPNLPWEAISGSFRNGRDRLDRDDVPAIQGAMTRAAAERLVQAAQLNAAARPGFKPVALPVRATLRVSSLVNRYTSHNIIARLPGSGRSGEAVLVLGHWDHLGICRPEGAPDRICNGAVDNASGLAMIIEGARHLSRGKRPVRDVLFMGTTAEESGLLGAEYYASTKPTGIVAAVNIDTVAIAGRGEPVAIVGRGTTPLDPFVDATARELGRKVDADLEANAFIQRQDGWALTKAGIPSVMVGGSFSNMAKLGTFLSGPYHKPNDDLSRPIELGGAAEDTDLTIALVRKLADPAIYRPGAR